MRMLTLAALAAALAFAEDVTVIRRDAPAPVERSTVIEKRAVETTGTVGGCETETVRSERCD
jgi:hypothetical protein